MIGVPIETSFPRLMGGDPAPELVAELISTYRRINAELAPEMLRLFPGIPDMLDRLKAAGFVHSIVTSKKTATALANLDQHRLRHLFAVVIGSDLCAKHKPDPEPAFACLRALGYAAPSSPPPPGTLVVGDSTHDIRMAVGAGIAGFGVSWGVHPPEQLKNAGAAAVALNCEDLVQIVLDS